MARTEQEHLTELLIRVRALEEAADRVEKSKALHQYPEQARKMAQEHRAEARVLWQKGVRPLPGTLLPAKKPQ